ncbi:MAG TPA: response regulator [Bacteroidales bacterium]|nr:response regulator [Bacteroidales bacterium]
MKFSPHILLIDDNPIAVKLLTSYLQEFNYTCLSANNGKQAFDLLANYAFSLIICDLHMPVMNGYDFICEFRKHQEYDLIPIIVISSDDTEESIVQILNSGADDFITKPIREHVFVSKIKALLQKNEIQKQNIQHFVYKALDSSQLHVLYCTGYETTFAEKIFGNTDFTYTVLYNSKELFDALYSLQHSIVCIDESATWVFQRFQRFMQALDASVPVFLFVSEGIQFPIVDSNLGVLYKHFEPSYIIQQILFVNSLLQRNKSQYIINLKKALLRSSFLFERIKEIDCGKFTVSVLHENYNDIPGGDFYEVFQIHDEYTLICMGDIMGKSWGAWMYVPIYLAYIRSTIKFITSRNISKIIKTPEKILQMLNQYCSKDLQLSEVFTTLSVVVIENNGDNVYMSSAGAISPLLYSNNIVSTIEINGNLLGIDVNSQFEGKEIQCQSGSVIVLYTDGYSEAIEIPTGKIVGHQKMQQIFQTSLNNSPRFTTLDFETAYLNMCEIQKFNDDRSLLVISRK